VLEDFFQQYLTKPRHLLLSVMVQPIKVKTKIYHTVKTIPKPNREIVEKGKIDTLKTLLKGQQLLLSLD
jgi:hypothetical protein